MTDEPKQLTPADKQKLALHLGVPNRVADLLVRMYNTPILTYDEIAENRVAKRPSNSILKLRKVLDGTGVEIHTQHGTGYWIDNTGRANIVRLIAVADTRLVAGLGE